MNHTHKLLKPINKESLLDEHLQNCIITLNSEQDRADVLRNPDVITNQSELVRTGKIIKCQLGPDALARLRTDSRILSLEMDFPKKAVTMGFPSEQPILKPINLDQDNSVSDVPIKAQALDALASIQNLPDGSGVDIVIVDGIAKTEHPEFANNVNGSGGSRLNRLNWYDVIGYNDPVYLSYPYSSIDNPNDIDNNHGTHVMGIAAGNTQGWTTKSKIYNISFKHPGIMYDNKDLYLQAVKTWHQNKQINPNFGNKNPTITNHSYGYIFPYFADTRNVLSINYRGQTLLSPRNASGAQCSANVSGGSISSISVTNQGSNYTNPPTVSFYGGGQISATAQLASGSVYKIIITDGGSGYTKDNPPTVTFSAPPSGGVRATGTVVSRRFIDANSNSPQIYVNEGTEFYHIGPPGQGQIYAIEIIEAGSGYTTPPTITFSSPGSGGRVAKATAEIKSNFIKKIKINNGGTGYFNDLSIPFVILSGGNPTETAVISVGPIYEDFTTNTGSIIDGVYEPDSGFTYYPSEQILELLFFRGGGNYQTPPTVSFYGGNRPNEGTKPEAHAILGTGANSNKVVSIVVTKNGSGYTSAPNVVLTNGGGFTAQQLSEYGLVLYELPSLPNVKFLYNIPVREPTIDEDIQNLISAGVVVVAAAGNNYYKIDNPDGIDYNNSIIISDSPGMNDNPSILPFSIYAYLYNIHYNRGSSPGSCPGVICVGAAGASSPEYKTDFSNTGPRVDIYAAGEYINSSTNTEGLADPRNNNYTITKWSGTSMASPQVAGALACYAQSNRSIDQGMARNFINNNAKNTLNNGANYKSLQGGSNKYLYMPNINVIFDGLASTPTMPQNFMVPEMLFKYCR